MDSYLGNYSSVNPVRFGCQGLSSESRIIHKMQFMGALNDLTNN